MSDHTKHLSFIFVVDPKYFSSAVKVIKPYDIYVRYTYDWRGVITLDDYNIKPGMAKWIVDWEGLESEMLAAAENNAKNYNKPGIHYGGYVRPEGYKPYDDIHDQWKQEMVEKERKGW